MAVPDTTVTQSIAFPFQFGPTSFPKVQESTNVVLDSLKSLVLTGVGERVMRNDIGTNANAYVFETLTELTKARIAADVKRAIDLYEPRAKVLAINPFEATPQGTILVDVIYRIAGQTVKQQIIVSAPNGNS